MCLNAVSGFRYANVTKMCTLEDLKFHQAGIQETIVFIAASMLCKQIVTSKQEGEDWFVFVWVFGLHFFSSSLQKNTYSCNLEAIFSSHTSYHPQHSTIKQVRLDMLHLFQTKQIPRLLGLMIYEMTIDWSSQTTHSVFKNKTWLYTDLYGKVSKRSQQQKQWLDCQSEMR